MAAQNPSLFLFSLVSMALKRSLFSTSEYFWTSTHVYFLCSCLGIFPFHLSFCMHACMCLWACIQTYTDTHIHTSCFLQDFVPLLVTLLNRGAGILKRVFQVAEAIRVCLESGLRVPLPVASHDPGYKIPEPGIQWFNPIYYSLPNLLMSFHLINHLINQHLINQQTSRDFSGGPMAKTLTSQYRGPKFNPWSGS